MSNKPPGRPPKHGAAMFEPITIRLPGPMMREIETIMASRFDAPDKATVVRELIAKGLESGGRRK